MTFTFLCGAVVSALLAMVVQAGESHTIRFDNRCGFGTPTLVQGGKILSTGKDYTSKGAFSSAIAYLQTGNCQLNGENCTLMEMTLRNSAAGGSSADISLIPPHKFSVPTSFSYFGGCDGIGATCSTPECSSAFFKSDDNQVQVACQKDNINLLITFCASATGIDILPFSTLTPPVVPPGRNSCGSRRKPLNTKMELRHNLKDLAHRRLLRLNRHIQIGHLPVKPSPPIPVLPLSVPLPFRLPRQQARLAETLQVQTEPEAPCQ